MDLSLQVPSYPQKRHVSKQGLKVIHLYPGFKPQCKHATPNADSRSSSKVLGIGTQRKGHPGMASWATELKRVCAKELSGSFGWQGASRPPEKHHPRYQGSEPSL